MSGTGLFVVCPTCASKSIDAGFHAERAQVGWSGSGNVICFDCKTPLPYSAGFVGVTRPYPSLDRGSATCVMHDDRGLVDP